MVSKKKKGEEQDPKAEDLYSSFYFYKEEQKDNPAFDEEKFKVFLKERELESTSESKEIQESDSKSKSGKLKGDENKWRGIGPNGPVLGEEQQGAYHFKESKFQVIWILFLISYFFTGIFTLVAGKVILDELDDWEGIEFTDYADSPFKKPQAKLTGLVMVISFGFQYLTIICDWYCLAVMAIGLPFFAFGDAAPKIAWKRASVASKVMQVICYVNMIPRVALTVISIYLGVAYSPFVDPIDGEKETFVTGAICITCVNLGFAPFLSLIVYLIYNLPITASRRRARADRERRGERTFVYEPFRNLNLNENAWSTGLTPSVGGSSLEEEEDEDNQVTSRDRTFADRVLRRRRDGFHSNPIATRPANLMRDLMEIEETLREVVDESNGSSNVGPCKEYQLGLIPLCYYLAMDEKKFGEVGNSNQDVKAVEEGRVNKRKQTVFMNDTIDLLGIEPLREIELSSNSNPVNHQSHWLNDIEEENEGQAEATSKDSIEVDQNNSELSKAERARLRLIGMAKKGKSRARPASPNQNQEVKGVTFSEIVGNASTSSTNPNPSNSNEFRIRLRPRPVNSTLKYPVLELPENQATCTICLTDYKSLDPILLEVEKNGSSRDDKSRKSKVKVEMKELDSMEPLRLLPCRHTFHKSCIDEWMTKSSARCVICQARVFPKHYK